MNFPDSVASYDMPIPVGNLIVYRKNGEWYARDPQAEPDTDASYFCKVSNPDKLAEIESAVESALMLAK